MYWRWCEENRNLLNVAISRAQDLLIVIGHRATLEQAGGILAAMVTYADGLDVDSFKPVAAVELDGAQHDTDPLTQARDRLKNSICGTAGLP